MKLTHLIGVSCLALSLSQNAFAAEKTLFCQNSFDEQSEGKIRLLITIFDQSDDNGVLDGQFRYSLKDMETACTPAGYVDYGPVSGTLQFLPQGIEGSLKLDGNKGSASIVLHESMGNMLSDESSVLQEAQVVKCQLQPSPQ